ncbi:helix-turn-helix domain-containing protein [Pseudoalteromonas sp. Of7M-16]|uniref:helix-turn-helix domain-containing protein n=1 Tax=Pseudoalteromonas sp. Of7M-16 TaxID=2917756 RepID=UPI001EF408CC|nr:helix-turn-helix domain-containing protein [Pseudoalteromonas sp. Of7M-16]MCG7547867.1 helix-turn-helix domain-containing protein [Pseudoalteromonas sp. Of7M-16]
MIAEALKAIYIVTTAFMLFVTVALFFIQGSINLGQKVALCIFWLLVSTPLIEYIGIAFNYMPYPFIAFTHSSVLFIGPAIFYYYRIYSRHKIDYAVAILHILPFLIFYTTRLANRDYIPDIAAFIYFAHIAFYQIVLVKIAWFKKAPEAHCQPPCMLVSFKPLVAFFLILSSAYASQIAMYQLGVSYLRLIWDITNTFTFIYVLLLSKGFIEVIKSMQSKPQRHLELTNEIAKTYITTLKALFDREQIHLNNELSLTDLANKLSLSKNQTSELLNEHLNIGFYALVNKYRVETAANLIKAAPEQVLMSQLYLESGFNNKNTFYKEFKKAFSLSPGAFRDKCSK